MKIIYDGPSLPMLEIGKEIFRIQILTATGWRTLETEAEYETLIDELQKGGRG